MSSSTAGQSVGQLETRGIEPVPEAECNGHPLQLFWVWFAANISILGLPLGATLVAFRGLAIWQAIIVAILGAAGSFAVVGIISIAGRRGRAPSLTLSRAIFGVRGNIGPTLVSLMSRLGWETVNTTTAAFVLLSLCSILFGSPVEAKSAPVLTLIFIAIFVLLTLAVSGLGHATLLVIQKWATYVFGALNILVGGFLCATIDWSAVFNATPAPLSAMIIGIGTMAAGTGIGWANAGADMSRYQHRSVKAVRLVASAAFGAGIPLVLLITLGGLLSVGNNDLASATDPIVAIRDMLPTWMAVPYLITAFGGLLLSNNLSVYSAGLTTLTLGLKVKRVYAVVVDIVAIFAGSIYFMLIADSFYGPFITFISLLAVPITAWVGIFVVDLIHRHYYSPKDLLDVSPSSAYWYRGGIEWRAFGAWAIAIVLGFSFTTIGTTAENVWFKGFLSDSWLGHNGLGWIVTFVVAGGLYLILGGAKDRRAAQPENAHA
ncbi:cytosine permease [Pseudomonas sp. HN2]|uniref:Allantoin permease n=1 Tax=Pseudomonas fluorescens TaxID=294 RepID=A0AAE2AR94_PSEFL|nr:MULTISPECIES: cytosine permease [Pseudomonas]KIP88860.1 allantoin permease [Pseudomonas fluorescens]KPG85936.1 allantoin permease [Pseudomonas sp. RIT-PI-o]MDR6161012.1 NCS1 family nucleobase:cation symporter-1 [Pseudomonas fluorescens]PWB28315.1 allantoin permease [Pseudomonas sp. NDM]UEB94493.1 cytosine permease [Pseudomonas sp. HN2]